jgi:GTP-binding protein
MSGAARLVASAAGPEGFPRGGVAEVAMLGRSNSGKSSLLNRLARRRTLARTSAAPGKTRLVHFYQVERHGRPLLLVDLPGYGYAKVARTERARWRALVEGYLEGRAPLRAAVLLHDLRREPSEDEHGLIAWLAEQRVPVLVALTKTDKLKPMRRAERIRTLLPRIGLPPDRVIPTSAATRDGIDALWRAIDRMVG